ncbi:nmrA-like family protein [Hirsutella rhossiliensis]|uniref:NmrA-like family domain-containing protein n=1 Tax=Hirsutella rhossiliensis TaxID=111463 RepID=A0A9P8MNW6_9HYPO|nr:nmrA-like family domain-containing protein [Hirsutella rhossiliensis]KAH0959638.1 nmrA-like family domain-containing protein [Hirsutella rhossiliensis]
MSPKKLVTVYGATGVQGGSVVDSLLQNKSHDFSLRAITRNPDSEKAKKLAARGVEVVKADGFHKDEVLEAFKGSWAVFVNTNTSDPALHRPGGITESGLGKLVVDAAFEAGVQYFVYSGLASATLTTHGAVSSEGFDEKYAVGEYAKIRGFKSVVIVSAGWYMENNLVREFAAEMGGFPFDVDDEGYLTFRAPRWGGTDEVPFISMEDDYGDLVHGVLLAPELYNGRFIHGISDKAKCEKMVSEFQKITGKKARYVPIDWKSIDTRGDPDLETVKAMFGFLQHSGGRYFGEVDDIGPARELKARATAAKGFPEELMTLERWMHKHYSP